MKKTNYTINPVTGNVIYEHVLEDIATGRRKCVVNECNTLKKVPNGFEYRYSCYAFPSRASQYLASV